MDEKELLKDITEAAIMLEYVGVEFEDEPFFGTGDFKIRFSVPEHLSTEFEKFFKEYGSTSEDLMKTVKKVLIGAMYKSIVGDNTLSDFNIEEIEEYVKFYAKTRKGETWTKEMADAKMKVYKDEMKEVAEWTEV